MPPISIADVVGFIVLGLFSLPLFYVYYWYISFLPIVIGFCMGLWKHNPMPSLYGIIISFIISFMGTLIVLWTCLKCFYPNISTF